MNMRTRVERVQGHDVNEVNGKIWDMQDKGWYLRGNPDFKEYNDGQNVRLATYLTFEKPEADESGKASEADMPAGVGP